MRGLAPAAGKVGVISGPARFLRVAFEAHM